MAENPVEFLLLNLKFLSFEKQYLRMKDLTTNDDNKKKIKENPSREVTVSQATQFSNQGR